MASAASTIARQGHASKPLAQDRGSRRSREATELGRVDRSAPAFSASVGRPAPYPTVLIAAASPEMRQWLSSALKTDGYLLLEAQSGSEVLNFARSHSRPIQVLLAQDRLVDDALAALLGCLRPAMQVVIIQDDGGQRGVPRGHALDKVRQLMQPVQQMAKAR